MLQTWNHCGGYYYHATHGRCACFLCLSFEVEVAYDFTHLHQLQAANDITANEYGYQHSQYECQSGAECDVCHKPPAGEVGREEFGEKVIQHLDGDVPQHVVWSLWVEVQELKKGMPRAAQTSSRSSWWRISVPII